MDSRLRGKDESLRGKDESLRGKDESLRGKDESLRGKDESLRGKDERMKRACIRSVISLTYERKTLASQYMTWPVSSISQTADSLFRQMVSFLPRSSAPRQPVRPGRCLLK